MEDGFRRYVAAYAGIGEGWERAVVMEAQNDNALATVGNSGAANDNKPLTFISMFSGIEAASCAFPQWKALRFAEIEKFPSAVLAFHYPDVPNVGDMTAYDWSQYRGLVDIVCGGPPCQAFSVAGLRNSMADARGNLSLAYMRALHAIKPRNAIVENVPGWLNTPDNAFGCFLAGLVGADDPMHTPDGKSWPNFGMVAGPLGRAAWRVLDAQYFGLAQRRRRVIVVADFGNGADPAAVLFEPEGLCRNSPPSRETGEGTSADVAPSLVSSGRGVERTGDTRGQDPVVAVLRGHSDYGDGLPSVRSAGGDCAGGSEALVFAQEIARCDATREGSSQDYESTTMVAVGVHGSISHTLKAEGADASEDVTGRGTPIVSVHPIAFTAKDYGGDAAYDVAPTLRAGTHSGSHANAGVMPAVTVALRGRDGGATAELGGEVATALRASTGGGDKPHVLTAGLPEVAGTMKACAGKTGGFSNSADHAAAGYMVPVTTSAVRRLTPVECERLQGFPDNYTAIPWRGKPASECPDGPRYKALGNSWAVPLFTWLGKRIDRFMPPRHTTHTTEDTRPAA